MIIKDYFSDGLIQIAIILSLLRSDLDSFLDVSNRLSPVRSHLLETNDGPLSGITRTDLNFHSRDFVPGYPKVLDSYSGRFSPFLRDLHSLSYYRRFDGISTNVHTWLVNEDGLDECSSNCERSTGSSADDTVTTSQNVNSLPVADDTSVVVSEPNFANSFFEDELSKEVYYICVLAVARCCQYLCIQMQIQTEFVKCCFMQLARNANKNVHFSCCTKMKQTHFMLCH